ncbi:hypothetical protein [Azospirillum sp. TSO22-1]|uniref:hypothetical protein n=1 Tax=Azospirillum sp. TSO22-1 TaxID=716789 RepID=UPI0011B64E29|nr:hypothetical protein [Azospirillum sp. TSO22-1]
MISFTILQTLENLWRDRAYDRVAVRRLGIRRRRGPEFGLPPSATRFASPADDRQIRMASTHDHAAIWLWHGSFRYFGFLGATCGALVLCQHTPRNVPDKSGS